MNRSLRHFLLSLLPALLPGTWLQLPVGAAVTFYGPIPYRQRSDSPFNSEIQAGHGYLETFEDRLLNTPNVSIRGGTGILRDQGVDEDDGVLDERGLSWLPYAFGGLPDLGVPWVFEITFTPNPEGMYPRWVGFAFLGFVQESLPERFSRFYQFFDPSGQSLSDGMLSVPVLVLPDDTDRLSSLGDQFVGAYSDQGIARVLIGQANRFDHLQYGYSGIPEPAGSVTVIGAAFILALRRRRR